ncbi:MAG: DMT family transporter [Hyphomicrobiaceae bacterium]
MAFLAFGVFIFVFQDVIIKLLSGGYPVHQLVFVRSVVALPLVFLILIFDSGLQALSTRRIGMHMLRGTLAFGCFTTYYVAMAALPIADVVAIVFSSPLLITLLSAVILKDRIDLFRGLAVLVGFIGVLLITRPGSTVFDWAALVAVLSAVFYAFNSLVARTLGRTDSGGAMSFYSMLMYLGISGGLGLVLHGGVPGEPSHPSLAFMARAWVMPTAYDLGLMSATGVISAIGFYCLAQGYRLGESSVVAPFEYTAMLWATIAGYLVFGEVPALFSFVGMGLIVAAGIFNIVREVRRSRRLIRQAGAMETSARGEPTAVVRQRPSPVHRPPPATGLRRRA